MRRPQAPRAAETLHAAAGRGDTATVRALLSAGADLEGRDIDGCTALHRAAQEGRTETVQELVAAGADVEAKDEYGART